VDAADQGMTPQRQEEVEERLRLAKGFLATTELPAAANEYVIRNALSRCYYPMYHLCNALLAAQDVPPGRRNQHGDLQKEIGRRIGDPLKVKLEEWQKTRQDADYKSGWVARVYSGEVKQFRDAAVRILNEARREFERYRVLITPEELKSEAPDERS
jgi:uncharacterized protein (UPF0332 family)